MGLLKENIDAQKLRGGYYTPSEITEFITKWAIDSETKKVLEPSCGDGNFVEAAITRFQDLGVNHLAKKVRGIELIPEEAEKAKQRVKDLGVKGEVIINSDFFNYIKGNGKGTYDAVIGNPPFIRYQNFPEEHRVQAIEMMEDLGLHPNRLTNIWVPFLVISASLLSNKGKLGMVIPAELFQVKYAAETRVFLSNFFDRITIVAFKKLVFKGIQQEVVLLLAEKTVEHSKGIRAIEVGTLEELLSIDFSNVHDEDVKTIDHSTEKWTKYFLEESEIELLRRLKQDERIMKCGDVLDVDVGIVTGRNQFFMMKESQATERGVKEWTEPVVSKSNQLKGLTFTKEDFSTNSAKDLSIHLFIPPNEEFHQLPQACQDYITYGEDENYHTGYKCRIRKRWYITPSLWKPDGFALRQVADYPKIIFNETEASSTDTIHRVRFMGDTDPKTICVSFLNSLTFAFSEITGRSYGGGVMTFEPTEIEEISIPQLTNLDVDLEIIDDLLRKREIEKVLDIVDKALLIDHHGFSKEEVAELRAIWRKLSNRRLMRNRSK